MSTTDTRAALERALNAPTQRAAWQGRLRVRCPQDDGSADHTAIDVRLPLSLLAVPDLLLSMPRCACGAELGLSNDGSTP